MPSAEARVVEILYNTQTPLAAVSHKPLIWQHVHVGGTLLARFPLHVA
jgi:hypothetical protein